MWPESANEPDFGCVQRTCKGHDHALYSDLRALQLFSGKDHTVYTSSSLAVKPAAESAHQSVWRNALRSMVHVLGAVSVCLIFDRASVVEACLADQRKKSTKIIYE